MQYTFFSAAHGTSFKTDHILGYKASLNKFKKVEIIPAVISDYSRIKLDNKTYKIFKHMETEQYTGE
jgi:hypothetical protein